MKNKCARWVTTTAVFTSAPEITHFLNALACIRQQAFRILFCPCPITMTNFNYGHNKKGLEMRDLLELIKDKPPEFYYSDILISNGNTLSDFINNERKG